MKCHHYCNNPLRCPECIKRFWRWLEQWTNNAGRSKRAKTRVQTAKTFYESTGT